MKRFIITLLIIFSIAHARGKIYGIVYHKNIPQSGVLVQLVNLKNDVIVRSKVTSKDGKYKFNIRNGDYKLIVSGDFPLVLKSFNITLNGKLFSPDVKNINPRLITISKQNKNKKKDRHTPFTDFLSNIPTVFLISLILLIPGTLIKRWVNKKNKEGKKLSTPEDIQFYDNNKKHVEQAPKDQKLLKKEPKEKKKKVYIYKVVERLVVLKENINDWIKTNWTKITEKVGNIIVSKSIRYKSRCWSCKDTIESIKSEYKMIGWVQNKWMGNKKCSRQGCNYFICNKCGKCLCDSQFSYLKSRRPVMSKWKIEKKTSRIKIIKEFIKSKNND